MSMFYAKVNMSENGTLGDNDLPPAEFRLLQPIWNLLLNHEYYVSSPLFPVVYSITFYFFMMLPFTILDLWGKNWQLFQKYKIQSDKDVTWPQVWNAISLTLWNNLLYILPISIAQWVYSPSAVLPAMAPTMFEFVWHQFAALVVFDLEYFIWHSVHHKIRFLYRYCHAVHHQYSSPSSWVTQYLHPWELLSVGFFSTTSPWIFKAHPLTEVCFQMLAIWVAVEAHIGYDFPFLIHNWNPLWGGAIKHDMHHQKPLTNFAPFFNWWDLICGTFCPGQLANGHRPQALLDWEKKERLAKEERRKLATDKKSS